MKKIIIVLLIILSLVLVAGCNQISGALDENCKKQCDLGGKFLAPGCTCPTPTPINVTQSTGE